MCVCVRFSPLLDSGGVGGGHFSLFHLIFFFLPKLLPARQEYDNGENQNQPVNNIARTQTTQLLSLVFRFVLGRLYQRRRLSQGQRKFKTTTDYFAVALKRGLWLLFLCMELKMSAWQKTHFSVLNCIIVGLCLVLFPCVSHVACCQRQDCPK